jgi:uncharacterized protein (UPF0276 family)
VKAGACGIGLRVAHYAELLERGPRLELAEVISENFLERGGRPAAVLASVRRDCEVALHGVSLSIGSVDPINERYLRALRELQRQIQPIWLSDHLCFGSYGGHYAHDLWPLPYTEEAIAHVVERVQKVQDFLGTQILLENVSSYVSYQASSMSEWEFINEVCARADCYLLLDVNNVIVSARNHGFSPAAYVDGLPLTRVRQLHLAGHSDLGTHLLDDHAGPVGAATWQLYRQVIAERGSVPVIVEWDENVPPLEELRSEAARARAVQEEVLLGQAAGAA